MTTIIEDFLLPDDTPDDGYVTFRLSQRAYQPGSKVHRTENDVTVLLTTAGFLTVDLVPTAGTGSDWAVPGVHYIVEEHLTGRPSRRYRVDVPTSSSPVHLGALVQL